MNALELYYADNNAYPYLEQRWTHSGQPKWNTGATSLQSKLSKYIPTLPIDPKNTGGFPYGNGDNFRYAYFSNVDSYIYCPRSKCYMIVFKLEKGANPYEQS